MSATNLLRNAKPVNVREAQAQLSKLIRSKSPSMVLSHGKPVSFLVPSGSTKPRTDLQLSRQLAPL